MKILCTSIFLLLNSIVFGQTQSTQNNIVTKDSITKFTLSLTTFNRAELMFNGSTTYTLTESSIEVEKQFLGTTKSKRIYSYKISTTPTISSTINNLQLDSLKDRYFNNCIMITSGNEYFLLFEMGSRKKIISLHHYYLKELAESIQIINSYLPKKYQFQYLTSDTKQDCDL